MRKSFVILAFCLPALGLPARDKDATQYGAGLAVNVPFPESEVLQVVQEIVQDGIVRGTKEYSKDQYLNGATSASSTRVFPERTETGKVFYKVRLKALAPWNFKESSDVGSVAVRYVVQGQDDQHTLLRVDARFVEDFRHMAHASNGSVEGAEYKDIHDRLESIESMKVQTTEAKKDGEGQGVGSQQAGGRNQPTAAPQIPPVTAATDETMASEATKTAAVQTLQEHVKDLRRQVERQVKAPGAPLKSAPFHSASILQTLPSGTEVLIVIATPYWLGVETHEGQHGWILRDDLELLP